MASTIFDLKMLKAFYASFPARVDAAKAKLKRPLTLNSGAEIAVTQLGAFLHMLSRRTLISTATAGLATTLCAPAVIARGPATKPFYATPDDKHQSTENDMKIRRRSLALSSFC